MWIKLPPRRRPRTITSKSPMAQCALPAPTAVAARRPLPQGVFDARRGQFHAHVLLGPAPSVKAERVLVVTDVDLCARNLNFVFGIAQCSGAACVISLFRLHLNVDAEAFDA
jgi:predicted Zn-dependent protease